MTLFSTAFSGKIIAHAKTLDRSRRALQALSSEILSGSKRAIFALHREDANAAAKELETAREKLAAGWKLVKEESRIAQEGMWRAAQEEFAEADLFSQYVEKGSVSKVAGVADDPDVFIGALSDLSGELSRRAVLLASKRDAKAVERIFADVSDIVHFLLEMDLTGSLRSKVDQAKQNLRKLEEIRYDLAIRA